MRTDTQSHTGQDSIQEKVETSSKDSDWSQARSATVASPLNPDLSLRRYLCILIRSKDTGCKMQDQIEHYDSCKNTSGLAVRIWVLNHSLSKAEWTALTFDLIQMLLRHTRSSIQLCPECPLSLLNNYRICHSQNPQMCSWSTL